MCLNATFKFCPGYAHDSFIEIRHFEYFRALSLFVVVFLTYTGIILSKDEKKHH